MMPMSPRGTTLAKPRGTPPMIAVPQSGPITKRRRSRASRLSAASSSIGTLSEKIMTCSPNSIALRASATAKSPGTEISARLAAGSRLDGGANGARRLDGRRRSQRTRLIEQPPCLRERSLSGTRIRRPEREDQVARLGGGALRTENARVAENLLVRRCPDDQARFLDPRQQRRSAGKCASERWSRDRLRGEPR